VFDRIINTLTKQGAKQMINREMEYLQELANRITSRAYTRREEVKLLTLLSELTAKMAKDTAEKFNLVER
jgi:Ribonuclease G/E